ncbi:exp1-like protein [Borealophlyctis nickersoniae]|nr:exp1-like protein [Borealophlyctis nickersoniae]
MNRTTFVVARVRTFTTAAAVAEPLTPPAEAARCARIKLKALGTPLITPPKQPLSAYTLFLQHEYENNPDLKKGSAVMHVKTIAKRWHDLSDAQKEVFKQKAETARSEYNRAYETYLRLRTPTDVLIEQKAAHLKKLINPTQKHAKVATDPNRPKRPLSGHQLFVSEVLRAPPAEQKRVLGESLEGVKTTDRLAKVAKAWGRMSKEDQEPYNMRSQEAFSAYRAQNDAYDAEIGASDRRKAMMKVLRSAVAAERKKEKAAAKKKAAKKAVRKVAKKEAGKETAAKEDGCKEDGC